MVVVLPVPLTPTTRTTAGPPATAERGRPVEVARDEQRGELGADGRLGTARVAAPAGALDEVDRERRADVAGDERLLDVVPGRTLAGAGPEEAAQAGHEAAAGPFEAGLEGGLGLGREDVGGSMSWTEPGPGRGRSAVRPGPAPGCRSVIAACGSGANGSSGSVSGSGSTGVPSSRTPKSAGSGSQSGSTSAGSTGSSTSGVGGSSRRRRQKGIRRAYPASARRSRSRAASACASSSRRLMTRLTESSPTVTP